MQLLAKAGFQSAGTLAFEQNELDEPQVFKIYAKCNDPLEKALQHQSFRRYPTRISNLFEWNSVFKDSFPTLAKVLTWKVRQAQPKIRQIQLQLTENEPISFHGMFPQNQQDFDDMGEIGLHSVPEGSFFQSPDEEKRTILKALQEKLDETKCNPNIRQKLSKVILDNWQAFCDRDSQCSMSRFTPMKVELEHEGYFKVPKAMNLSPKEGLALKNHLVEFEKLEIIRKVKNPMYGSRTFVVPKKVQDTVNNILTDDQLKC